MEAETEKMECKETSKEEAEEKGKKEQKHGEEQNDERELEDRVKGEAFPMQEIESLCMRCGENVYITYKQYFFFFHM